MANKILKTISIKWDWQGDIYMLKGFNIALMKNDANPINGLKDTLSYISIDTHCYNPNENKFEYTFNNIAIDNGVKCTPWIQALFNNEDSEWISLDGAVIEDDGNATIVVIGNPTFQQVIDMSTDNKITPQEKLQLKKEWDEITSDHFSIYAGITKARLDSENQDVKAYITAANDLAKYLNNNKIYYWHQINDQDYVYPEMIVDGLTTDLNTGHYVSVDTYRDKVKLYYKTKVQILHLIEDTIMANNNELIQSEIDKNTLPSTIPVGGYSSCDFTKNKPNPGCVEVSIGSFSTTTGHKFNIESPQFITTSLTSNKHKTRWILFVGADYSRFQIASTSTNNSNMFITATHKKGKWYYFDGANDTPKEFTPMPEDCVVARLDEYNSTQTANNGIESIKFYISTSDSIFHSLTDGGKLQGMFNDEGGRLFINAEFIKANSITADKMNIKGLKVVNSQTGETTFEVTPNGEIHICANKFVLTAGSTTNVPTKDQVKDDIDNIKIGVRNIFKNGDNTISTKNYKVADYYTHKPLERGKTYTLVFKGSISEGQKFGIFYNNGYAGVGTLERKPGSAIYIHTFEINLDLTQEYISIFNIPNKEGVAIATIEWACLYEGNVKPPLDYVKPIEDIQVGGRNLLRNSLSLRLNGSDYASNVDIGTPGKLIIKNGTNRANGYVWIHDYFTEPINEKLEYCFSVDVKTNYTPKPDKAFLEFDFRNDNGVIKTVFTEIPNTQDKWVRINVVMPNVNTPVTRSLWCFTINGNSGLTTLEYRNPKLEQGNKGGDWTPAPEDVDESINNKVNIGGSIDDINQSPSGQISYPKLNIRGAISFDDLASEIGQNFIAKKDSQGNRIQTVINGKTIETGSVTADKMTMYNLNVVRRKMVNGKWQDIDTSFSVTDEGRIRASGTFSSFNFRNDIDVSKSEGWMISEDGDSVFNNSLIRGRVELPNAGMTDYGGGKNYNILKNTDYRKSYTKNDVGWDNSKNGTLLAEDWGGYNNGVTRPNEGYHAHLDNTTFPFPTFLYRNKNSEIGLAQRWMGSSQTIHPTNFKANTKYTFSIDIYFTKVGSIIDGGLYYYLKGETSQSFHSGQYSFKATDNDVGKWKRFSWTFTTNANMDLTKWPSWYIYGYGGGVESDTYVTRAKLEEGEIATPYASTADIARKEVRIYAGTDYYNRYNAPFRVLQDGSIIATKGEFNGTVTGRLEIGNISIYDDLTTPGVIEIKNNDNSKTVVKIGEEYSEFKSNVYFGSKDNYVFKTNLDTKQLVSGKQSSLKLEYERDEGMDGIFSNSITLSGEKILFNQNEYIKSFKQGEIEIGTNLTKGLLRIRSNHDQNIDGILGQMDVSIEGSAKLTQSLQIGNTDFVPIYPSGLDIFVN